MSEKRYNLNSNTSYGWTNPRVHNCRKSGFPRHKVNEYEGTRMNKQVHRYMTDRGWKDGGNFAMIAKKTHGLLTKFVGKPYDEFMRVYNERMKYVKHKFVPEFGYNCLEDYIQKCFLYTENPAFRYYHYGNWDLFIVDGNGIIHSYRRRYNPLTGRTTEKII
jgi:hypothetical protein